MNEVLSKISSYNLFNFLLPGAVFSILAQRMSLLHPPDQIVEKLIWYYFIGMVLSRLGSILVEPILKRLKFVTYSEYNDYLTACKLDQKIEIMVEVSNTYRTITTAFLALLLGALYVSTLKWLGVEEELQGKIGIGLLLGLFLLSFKKQVGFISLRVKHCAKDIK